MKLKQNSVSLLKFNVGTTDDIKIVEIKKCYGFVKKDEFTCADLKKLGHSMTMFRLQRRGTTTARKLKETLKLTKKIWVPLMEANFQEVTFPTVIVRRDSDFDNVLNMLASVPNSIVNIDSLLVITNMETEDEAGNVFTWQRIAVGTSDKGALEKKLILTHLNGEMLSKLDDKDKKNILKIVGKIAMRGLCKINKNDVSSVECGGYENN